MLRLAYARRVAGGIAGCALAGSVLCVTAGMASAEPAPAGCTAADLAKVSAAVASETSKYMFDHSDVNDFFTKLKSAQHDDVQNQVEAYMKDHPQVHSDLQRIRQPRTDLQKRCQWLSDDLPD